MKLITCARVQAVQLSDRSHVYDVLFNTGLNDAAGNILVLRIGCESEESARVLEAALTDAIFVEHNG